MEFIKILNNVRKEIEIKFQGLPHAHASLIKSLLNYADPQTGMIEGLSCRDLCLLLVVDPACGRKGAGIPKIETIRSYLRTIASNFPEDFKVVSVGQKLKLQFISLPALYQNYLGSNNLYGDQRQHQLSTNNQSMTDLNHDFSIDDTIDFHEECESNSYITITNKQTNNSNNQKSKNNKQPISLDFFPSEETILIAKQKCLLKVTDTQEIQNFIQHNLKNETKWSDYNPIFLKWLERGSEYEAKKQKVKTRDLRSESNESSSKPKKYKSREQLLREVFEANREELESSDYNTSHFDGMDENDLSLRAIICDEVWDERRWNLAFSPERFDAKGVGGGYHALNAF
jgi:hypothetical protein